MNGGGRDRYDRGPGLRPWFTISIAGHVILIALLGLLGLNSAPEIRERLSFKVGLAQPKPQPTSEASAPPDNAPQAEPSEETDSVESPTASIERRESSLAAPETNRQPKIDEPQPLEEEPAVSSRTVSDVEPLEAAADPPSSAPFFPTKKQTEPYVTAEPSSPIGTTPESPAGEVDVRTDLTAAYLERISELVDRTKRYPPLAARKRLQGRVLVGALLDSSGDVLEARVLENPDPLLSQAALKALRKAAPFGSLPGGRETLEVSVPVRFILTR